MKGNILVALSFAMALAGCGGGASDGGTSVSSGGGASSGVGVTKSILYSFGNAPDGAVPDAALIQGTDGNFYGTTANGGNGYGTVFEVTPAGAETVLYSFAGGSDGSIPFSSLTQGSDGNFYGTTYYGGASNGGTVFEVTPAGVETVLHAFSGGPSDGSNPFSGVIQGSDGNFYGTTYAGGANKDGTLFEVTPSAVETVLYSFDASNPNPYTGVIQGSDGNFYGTTSAGGTNKDGTVFEVTPAGVGTVLYSFAGGSDGADPSTALIQGSDGNFYGTTQLGGTNDDGVVFKVTPAGVETVLYAFTGSSDGANPSAALIQGSDGNFYGTASYGGTGSDGTVFEVTPAGAETMLYSFGGGTDGDKPTAALVQGSDGNFYGTTSTGGANTLGSVFKIAVAP